MRTVILPTVLAGAVMLSGCMVNPIAYHRADVSQRQMNADYDACRVQGLQQVPADRVTTAQYDTNFSLRQNVIAACMAQRGYAEVTLPACGPGVSPPDLSRPVTLTGNTCVFGGDRYYAFVNR